MKRLSLILTLAALLLIGVVTADGSSGTNRAVTVVTTDQTFQTIIGPGAGFNLHKSAVQPGVMILDVKRVNGHHDIVGFRGFQRLVVSAAG